MAKNPYSLPKTKEIPMREDLSKSAGILDDFAVRKDVATQQGTITKTPVNDNDIVNKSYADTKYSSGSTATFANITDSALTSGRLPLISTNGLLIDDPGFSWYKSGSIINVFQIRNTPSGAANVEFDFMRATNSNSCRMFFMTGTGRWDWNFGMLGGVYDFTIRDEYNGKIRLRCTEGTSSVTDNITIDGTTGRTTIKQLNVSTTASASPSAGDIYFDGTHFQGYDGSNWKQLDN
jgi:hypothetical protein